MTNRKVKPLPPDIENMMTPATAAEKIRALHERGWTESDIMRSLRVQGSQIRGALYTLLSQQEETN